MIDQVEMMRVIEKMRGNAIVVPAMRAGIGWSQVSQNVKRDVPASNAMGKTASFGLGVALAQPDTRVIVFDGDGSLLMNLGELVTTANKSPRNLCHFLMDNGVYATTGGQPVPGGQQTDYLTLAKGAGYAHCYQFDNLEDFVTQAQEVMNQQGPVFVWVKTVPNIRDSRSTEMGMPRRRAPEAIKDLMEELGTRR